ncbi:MAG: FecR family protein, partial [Arcicella sp.]|nr:FecR family protein [Arcicella sp.]
MNQYEFDILLEKYLAGNCTEQEEEMIQEWYEKEQEKTLTMSNDQKVALENRIWSVIQQRTFNTKKGLKLRTWQKYSLVACLLLLLMIPVFLVKKQTPTKTTTASPKTVSNEGIIVKNTTQKPREIRLEDGSIIQLSANSSISYPEHFGNKQRNVYLKGEAFFDVQKDPTKPFIVHAGNLTTEVLGTSFRIKSYEEAQTIEVSVKTGRVSVFEDNNEQTKTRKGMILTPNQRVIFNKYTKEIIPAIVIQPSPIIQVANAETFIFEETPVEQVLSKLRRIYGLEMVVENQALNHCVFTGDLNDLPLDTQLDLICKSINSTHEQRGTSIF